MDIFEILKNLYTNKSSKWINEIDEHDIVPFVIQRWITMNDGVRVQARWLDKYVFHLPPKMYLSLAWSIMPKTPKVPFVKYIKQKDESDEFDFILQSVRKHLNLADNDYVANKDRIIKCINDDMVNWFSFYGIPKKYWKRYHLKFDQIKDFRNDKPSTSSGLSAWGL